MVGPYRLVSLLGVGGMGQVFLGEHPAIGSRVAVKVLSRDCLAHPELVDRFFAEALTVNRIRHEGIVNVLDLAQLPDGRPYIVMEFLTGAPLNAVIQRAGALPIGSFVRVIVEVLDALAAAHQGGVIHRDLKPDNLFVTPNGRAKVLDFGIAKLMPEFGHQGSETKTGALLGTPHYMAPEQVRGGNVDARTDIYAVGCILYEGLTGRRPFLGATLYELFQQHLEAMPVLPTLLRPELPPALQEIILCALAKNPAERFASAAAMGKALASSAGELPEAAWAPLVDGDGHLTVGPASVRLSTPARHTPSAEQLGQLPTARASQVAEQTVRDDKERTRRWVVPAIALIIGAAVAAVVVSRSSSGSSPEPTAAAGVDDDAGAGQPGIPDEKPADEKPADEKTADLGTEVAQVESQEDSAPAGTPAKADNTPRPPRSKKSAQDPLPSKSGHSGGQNDSSPDKTTTAPPGPDKPSPIPTTGAVTLIETASPPGKENFKVSPEFNAKRFDGVSYIATAERHARKVFSDAVLVEFDVPAVHPAGYADLTIGRGLEATYWFRSPSRSKRPADQPRGVDVDIRCMVYVDVSRGTVNVYSTTAEKCNQPKRPRPRCSLKQVWDRAAKLGAPTSGVVAKITYLWDGWYFDIDGEFSESIKDDC